MAKVAIQQIIDAGFSSTQFGTPADWDTPSTGYLARVIDEAALWAAAKVGQSAYDAAVDGVAKLRLARAELCYVKAELWRRRAAFLDSNAQSALDGGNGEYLNRREFLAHAEQADACAAFWIDEFTSAGNGAALAGSGATLGYVATGPYRVGNGVIP